MPARQPLVLCVDDEFGGSEHRILLDRHGYHVIAVTSAGEGLSVLREKPVDAIILNLGVPGTNGGAVVRRMKKVKPHIPVLLVCPSASIPPGRSSPADGVVVKNEAPVRLLEVLDDLLNVRFPFFSRWFGNWKHRAGA